MSFNSCLNLHKHTQKWNDFLHTIENGTNVHDFVVPFFWEHGAQNQATLSFASLNASVMAISICFHLRSVLKTCDRDETVLFEFLF